MEKGIVESAEGNRYRVVVGTRKSMPIPAVESVRHKEAVLGEEHVIEKDILPLEPGDTVICWFFDDSLKNGVILGKVSA